MLLKELMLNCPEKFAETDVLGITSDSRQVKAGYAFVCINGALADGHNYASSAVSLGASVVICERDLGIVNQIIVEDTHREYAYMCAAFFGFPTRKLKIIGVTGTNGKTSVTYMIKSILEAAGNKVGLIGTIQNMICDRAFLSENTTPGIYDLQKLFAQMCDAGCTYAIMEVSSHALDQRRVEGIHFDVAAFTNLTQDHLDYHKTMENYMMAKRRLFENCDTAVLNYDDEYTEKLVDGINCKKTTFSAESNESTYSAKDITYRPDGLDYKFVGFGLISRMKLKTGGKFSVYNSMCAATVALELGIPMNIISESLASIDGIKGRAEIVPTGKNYTIVIDYAHTPDGLKNILTAFRGCNANRITVLFGCGGDRDKTKRPIMGNIAAHYADNIIVTSDNPRSENPADIIKDILAGMQGIPKPYKVIENRREAIKYAVKTARDGDIIILAGKGHETYQVLADGKIHFDEREIVKEALEEK